MPSLVRTVTIAKHPDLTPIDITVYELALLYGLVYCWLPKYHSPGMLQEFAAVEGVLGRGVYPVPVTHNTGQMLNLPYPANAHGRALLSDDEHINSVS